ncbi:MAG: caspase domain-containing protein, partial [Rhizobiaceae bacterium]
NQYPLLQTACSGKSCDLRYPVADAAGFASTIAEKSAGLYTGMETLVLVNRESLDESPAMRDSLAKVVPLASVLEPEADSITDELADFLEKPTKDDTTIVFVAGHGINVGEDYYFIPSDGRTSDNGEFRRSSLVDWGDIQKAVERAEGTRLMLLDTCHAANAFNPRLEKDAADSRIVVFSATAANSTAQERTELGHGVFTYAVLNGLRGDANTSGDGVRLLGLADYIYREVTRITQEQQKPFYYISNMENILLAEP